LKSGLHDGQAEVKIEPGLHPVNHNCICGSFRRDGIFMVKGEKGKKESVS